MFAQTSPWTLSPATLLWLVFSFFAAVLLFSTLNHRRTALTSALKAFVRRHDESAVPEVRGSSKVAEEAVADDDRDVTGGDAVPTE
ncbi:hypothetical protein [Novipirellula artificiosorum]|uniref:CcmD family protein n=1 Tax=Novipirellula artificiosorum TaxID=2528016 RepID=A0A5C6DW12_9BACT|nr:hypothetical protein [Novipirellula artificiosorum]TWU40920.1 hypothetical protein Poly41_17550 [Novipirellula artificiosorum]